MKKKIQIFVSLLMSIFVLSSLALPAFADLETTDNGIVGPIFYRGAAEQIKLKAFQSVNCLSSYNSNDFYIILFKSTIVNNVENSFPFLLIEKKKFEEGYPVRNNSGSFSFASSDNIDFTCITFAGYFLNSSVSEVLQRSFTTGAIGFHDNDFNRLDIVYSDIPIYDEDGNKHSFDTGNIPAPYSISYAPTLGINTQRVVNGHENTFYEVDVSLNKEYLDWYIKRKCEDALNVKIGTCEEYSIQQCLDTVSTLSMKSCAKSKAIYFVSLSDVSKSLKKVTDNSIYTYLHDTRYSMTDRNVNGIDGSTSTAVYANGYYPYFTVDFADKLKDNFSYSDYQALTSRLPAFHLTVALEQFNSEVFNPISVLHSIFTAELDFSDFDTNFYDEMKKIYNLDNSPSGVSFSNDSNWQNDTTSYQEYFSKSSRYFVSSIDFSFDSYPAYKPLKDADGNDIDMIKRNPFNFANNPVPPRTYQGVNSDGTLTEERTKEQQKEYDDNIKIQRNFPHQDFTDFTKIFDTTGVYFQFLTVAFQCLPSWFLTIFTAWFIMFLALSIIKFVFN